MAQRGFLFLCIAISSIVININVRVATQQAGYRWVATTGFNNPCGVDAIMGGIGANHNIILAARFYYNGNLYPGFIQQNNSTHPAISVDFAGRYVATNDTSEVLCADYVAWHYAYPRPKIPDNAIPAGHLQSNTTLYACRRTVDNRDLDVSIMGYVHHVDEGCNTPCNYGDDYYTNYTFKAVEYVLLETMP